MPLELTLKPVSMGKVFLSSESSKDTIPNTPLPRDHPFHTLWKRHLTELVDSPLYNLVIDAFRWRYVRGLPTGRQDPVDTWTVAMIECDAGSPSQESPGCNRIQLPSKAKSPLALHISLFTISHCGRKVLLDHKNLQA